MNTSRTVSRTSKHLEGWTSHCGDYFWRLEWYNMGPTGAVWATSLMEETVIAPEVSVLTYREAVAPIHPQLRSTLRRLCWQKQKLFKWPWMTFGTCWSSETDALHWLGRYSFYSLARNVFVWENHLFGRNCMANTDHNAMCLLSGPRRIECHE